MNKEQKEKIAISAANTWCRCFKCDGKVNATGYTCDQDKKLTCHKWYDGYRTAMLALSEYEQQMMKEAVDGIVEYKYSRSGRDLFNVSSLKLLDAAKYGLNNGKKVKLIIIKDDLV